MQMLKNQSLTIRVTFFHVIISGILGAGVHLLWGHNNATSCLIGCALVGFNLVALVWAWRRVFNKKSMDIAVGVIVIKYAILGFGIYWVVSSKQVDMLSFLIGCGSIIATLAMISFSTRTADSKLN